MRLVGLILALALLAGCDTGTPRFGGIPAQEVDVGAMRFAVKRRGPDAEATRLNAMAFPRYDIVAHGGIAAIERTTRCNVVPGSVIGDPSVLRATLECPPPVP